MALSRSPLEFIRRQGWQHESLRPSPRLNLSELLVHTAPISSPPLPGQATLRSYEGTPPPDRNASRPWPGQLEEEE